MFLLSSLVMLLCILRSARCFFVSFFLRVRFGADDFFVVLLLFVVFLFQRRSPGVNWNVSSRVVPSACASLCARRREGLNWLRSIRPTVSRATPDSRASSDWERFFLARNSFIRVFIM